MCEKESHYDGFFLKVNTLSAGFVIPPATSISLLGCSSDSCSLFVADFFTPAASIIAAVAEFTDARTGSRSSRA